VNLPQEQGTMVSPNLKFPMLLALAAFITQSLAVPIKPLCMDGSVIINEQSGTTFFVSSALSALVRSPPS